jgi:hypothetical protein
MVTFVPRPAVPQIVSQQLNYSVGKLYGVALMTGSS